VRQHRIAAVVVALMFGSTGTAGADPNEFVVVGFGVSVMIGGETCQEMGSCASTAAACQLRGVPLGSDGTAVLAAAVAQACIDSYETEPSSYNGGTYVRCISAVCNRSVSVDFPPSQFGITWRVRTAGDKRSGGAKLEEFRATVGSEMVVELVPIAGIWPV
jgi:hypothetical protein